MNARTTKATPATQKAKPSLVNNVLAELQLLTDLVLNAHGLLPVDDPPAKFISGADLHLFKSPAGRAIALQWVADHEQEIKILRKVTRPMLEESEAQQVANLGIRLKMLNGDLKKRLRAA